VSTRIGQNETHPVQHRLLRSHGRRQHLACPAILAHIQDDIRERASDIDGKPHLGSFKHSKSPRADRRIVAKYSAISVPLTTPAQTCPAILPGAYAAQLRRAIWSGTCGVRKLTATFCGHRKKYRAPISHWYGARVASNSFTRMLPSTRSQELQKSSEPFRDRRANEHIYTMKLRFDREFSQTLSKSIGYIPACF
jgi:hypothetical protein